MNAPKTARLFSIRNKVSGVCMGAWHAPTIEAALNMLARAAGYRDHAHANSVVGGADDLEVVEIRPLAADAPREAREVWARSLGFYSWDAYAHDIERQIIEAGRAKGRVA